MLSRKHLLITGIIAYLSMGVMALLLYKERVVFTDIAFHLFDIIRTGKFAIQNNRFGALFTQAFPLISSKAGFSLEIVAKLYSLSFVVLPFLVFIGVLRGLKQDKMALVLLLCNTLMVTHTFYWIQSELPQGIAIAVIWFALLYKALEQETIPAWFAGWSAPLLFFIVFVHPLMLFLMVFGLLFAAIHHRTRSVFIGYNLMAFVCMYYVKSQFFKTEYDSQAMDGVKNLFNLLPRFFTLESTQKFLGYLVHDYYLLLLGFVTVNIWYAIQRNWLKLALFISFFSGFICIVHATYPRGTQQYYIENQYLILSFIVIVPFVFDLLPEFRLKQWSIAIVPLIVFVGLLRMGAAKDTYTRRLDWMRQFMTETSGLEQKKLVVDAKKAPLDILLMTWGSHYEFWLLSTIEQGNTRSITIEEKAGEYDWTMGDRNAFITRWGVFNYKELNKKYFILNDTTQYKRY